MLKLCPIKYGVSMSVPPVPTGNVWMAVDGNIGNVYVGEYDGSGWTLQTNDYSGVMGGPHLRVGSNLYLGSTIQYCDVSDVSNWTTLGGATNNNILQMISDGTYGYACRGFNEIGRWTLPFGSMSQPLAGSTSWSETATIWNGDLYIMSPIDNRVKVSTDAGLNYTDKTEFRPLGFVATNPRCASNDDIIVVAFSDNNGTGPVKVSWTEDGASTWTIVTPPITADTNPSVTDCVWTGSEFILCTFEGRTAYSTDGKTWYAGTSINDTANISVGIGKTAIGAFEVNIYETTNGGGTWTEMPEIVASTNTTHNAWIYWIGNPP